MLNKSLQFGKNLKKNEMLNQSSVEQIQEEIKEKLDVEPEYSVQQEIEEK